LLSHKKIVQPIHVYKIRTILVMEKVAKVREILNSQSIVGLFRNAFCL
jgi:hypothetical protein